MQNQARVPHGVAANSKVKILVVDDDRKLLQKVRSHLEKRGYEVATAEDGTSALELVQSFSPNLVVLDINFPDSKKSRSQNIDGVEVLGRLREAGNLPILMLSTSNIPAVKAMALSMGADDYVTKPVEMKELCTRIAAVLRRTGSE